MYNIWYELLRRRRSGKKNQSWCFKIFGVRARAFKQQTRAESGSKKCDSIYLCHRQVSMGQPYFYQVPQVNITHSLHKQHERRLEETLGSLLLFYWNYLWPLISWIYSQWVWDDFFLFAQWPRFKLISDSSEKYYKIQFYLHYIVLQSVQLQVLR